ncbi:hypothetical protein [Alkalihalobacillus sp. TS-13]|uniref:hypothetical protein n=1 Tax=Alkalihalobacillus sp. TS-13 TaxID=2842455 RepID=UPI001C86A159|nr:hypothetical protein [Alkalihalobacillus sp. TS-13]
MKVKPRHFPHPVLSFFSDDFNESTFDAKVEPIISENSFEFLIDFNLNNQDLRKIIAEEKAKFMVHIECVKTWVRLAEKTSNSSIEVSVPAEKLHDRADVCVFVVADQDIPRYRNDCFHPDFEGEFFQIKKGDILAVGPEISVNLEKKPLEKINSIFQLVKDPTYKEGDMSVNVESEKITVLLSIATHSKYQQLIRDPNLIPVFHTMIAVPALVYALSYIKETFECQRDLEELTSYSWYKSISRRLEEMNIDIENTGSLEDPVSLAVKLVNKPMVKAIKAIEKYTEEH